jgi:DNA primase
LLVARGAEPFRQALEQAVEVLEFKLQRVWAAEAGNGLEGQRRAVEQVLAILAAVPDERSVKLELMVNRIAHRLNLKEETVWMRYRELRAARRASAEKARPAADNDEPPAEPRSAPAPRHEVRLLEVLLANPSLVAAARDDIKAEELEHAGLRLLLECLYRLLAEGAQADLDHLQERLDNERLLATARKLQDRGLDILDGGGELKGVVQRFEDRRVSNLKQALRQALEAGDARAVARLQDQLKEFDLKRALRQALEAGDTEAVARLQEQLKELWKRLNNG